ncbi:AAA family ATPase [Sporosarcina sp. 179-K 8C2 HS]|uniref:AAA family ATPase n=1 Tax=Sporosarcina sp. 179-K 8C2 HS TaxID=3142387 RepID=UPI0039A27841
MGGFTINKLMLIGPMVKPVFVGFEKGLNIITGPSDSGKTYIFECINFLLGSSEKPKSIPEGKGYETALLEITTNGKIVTLERQLQGGVINLYLSDINEIGSVKPKLLFESHVAGKTNNISGYLLSLSGFTKTNWIKKNGNNKKISLSFRHLRNYITISEERIISKKSPIHSGQYADATLEKSVLKLLLTGEDDSQLDETEKPEIIKAKVFAKLEILDEMIENTRTELNSFNTKEEIQDDAILEIKLLKEEFSVINQNIDNLNIKRQESLEDIKFRESRSIVINALLVRFNLLEEQYNADIKRLEFINEGTHYFSQLNTVSCPFCGTPIENDKCQTSKEFDVESVNMSCLAEIDKIQLNIRDLKKSSSDLKKELEEINNVLYKKRREYEKIESDISEVLRPKSEEIKEKIDEVLKFNQTFIEVKALKDKLDDFLILRETLSNQKDTKNINKTNAVELVSVLNDLDFKDYISNILEGWAFDNKQEIEVELEEVLVGRNRVIELLISDKQRSDFGKGYRALLYSAFVIGLLRFCKNKNLPHPGFVILDSPVTTFKEAKQKSKDNDDEIVPNNIQQSFFEDLAKNYKDTQIILFENKVPPININKDINLIEFTKDHTQGRFGFYNVSKS